MSAENDSEPGLSSDDEAMIRDLERKVSQIRESLADPNRSFTPQNRAALQRDLMEQSTRLNHLKSERARIQSRLAAEMLSAKDQRAAEVRYLTNFVAQHDKLIGVYTELSIVGLAESTTVKIKPAARRYLSMSHTVHAPLGHSSNDDRATTFAIHTLEELLTLFTSCRQMALIGEPGSGKTTTLIRVALELAKRALDDPAHPIPVFVRLGDYRSQPLLDFVQGACKGLDILRLLPERIVLLFDGLNELAATDTAGIATAIEQYAHIPLIVSCRRLDYIERKLPLKRVDVRPLDLRQIFTFIGNYFEDFDRDRLFWELAGQEARAAWEWFKRTSGLRATFDSFWFGAPEHAHSYEVERQRINAIREGLQNAGALPGLLTLMTSPFLLVSTIIIYIGNREPPANRGQLFVRYADLLIEKRGRLAVSRDHPWIDSAVLKRQLAGLAFEMIECGKGTAIDASWANQILSRQSAGAEAAEILHFGIGSSILHSFEANGVRMIRFGHQLLQEYFAALVLEDKVTEVPANQYWPSVRWWEPTGWEEVAVLLAGISGDATRVVEWLTPVNPTLAHRCVVESGSVTARAVVQALYEPPTGARVSPAARAEWGRQLANTGDVRPGVGLGPGGLPDICWCRVPAGAFTMGGDDSLRALGIFQQKRSVDLQYDYYLAKYPVTYSQFKVFVSDGYQCRDNWTDAGWRWKGSQNRPRYWEDPTFSISNHPVIGVSWFEAYAFCKWLDGISRHQSLAFPVSSEGWEISLPREAEWEKAARYPDERQFPWGNHYEPGRANIDETFEDDRTGPTFLRRTTAVGLYDSGKSELGILDLAGNVWEWMLSKWEMEYRFPENVDAEGTEHRGVRGGSWYNSAKFCACAAHDCFDPDLAVNDVGFRLVLRPIQPSAP